MNNLTSHQRSELIDQFVELQVDNMDTKTMAEWITDELIFQYGKLTNEELKERVDCYNEDGLYEELVYNVCSDDKLTNSQLQLVTGTSKVSLQYTTRITEVMRKIETQMQNALRNRVNWSSGNTTVFNDNEGNQFVTLHGNLIASISNFGDIKLSSCGWQTVTTKSRLNAILDTFLHGLNVFQNNFEWFIGDDKFFDGYTIHRQKITFYRLAFSQ